MSLRAPWRITEEELRSVLSELIGYFDDDKKRR